MVLYQNFAHNYLGFSLQKQHEYVSVTYSQFLFVYPIADDMLYSNSSECLGNKNIDPEMTEKKFGLNPKQWSMGNHGGKQYLSQLLATIVFAFYK